jgi:hypothetical protein
LTVIAFRKMLIPKPSNPKTGKITFFLKIKMYRNPVTTNIPFSAYTNVLIAGLAITDCNKDNGKSTR